MVCFVYRLWFVPFIVYGLSFMEACGLHSGTVNVIVIVIGDLNVNVNVIVIVIVNVIVIGDRERTRQVLSLLFH